MYMSKKASIFIAGCIFSKRNNSI